MTYHTAGIAPPKRGEIVCRHHDLLISKGTKSYLNEATTSGYGKVHIVISGGFFLKKIRMDYVFHSFQVQYNAQ